jgi:hypothetical protein
LNEIGRKIDSLKFRLKQMESQKAQGIITPQEYADLLSALENELRKLEDIIFNTEN